MLTDLTDRSELVVRRLMAEERHSTMVCSDANEELVSRWVRIVRDGGRKRRFLGAFLGSEHDRIDVEVRAEDGGVWLELTGAKEPELHLDVALPDSSGEVGDVAMGRLVDVRSGVLFEDGPGRELGRARLRAGNSVSDTRCAWDVIDPAGVTVATWERDDREDFSGAETLLRLFADVDPATVRGIRENRFIELRPVDGTLSVLMRLMPALGAFVGSKGPDAKRA